jgi:hypothetical protein
MNAVIGLGKRRAAGAAGPLLNGSGSSLRGSGLPLRGSRSLLRRCLRSGLAVLAASVMTAGVLSMQPAAAAGGPSWTVQPTPNARAPESLLPAVSCSAASACTAVAQTARRPSTVLRWNGRTWSTQATAAVNGGLSAVSCPSRSSCVAVGTQRNPLPDTLAEAWDGTSWTVLPMPVVSGALSAVSCTSATACMATGSGGPSGATLAEAWNGSTWAVVPTPPVGGETSNLDSVSCTSASACTAVGDVVVEVGGGGQKEVPLAERWNGTGWTVQATPKPSAGGAASLASVSCTSASSCTAVGSNSGFVAEHWDGTRWAIQPSVPADVPSAVSCTSSTACTAVAWSLAGSETLRWNGSGWAIQHASAWSVHLFGVSCTSATSCTAVGQRASLRRGGQVTLAEQWNGVRWAPRPTTDNPTVPRYNLLTGVSCGSAAACVAVGGLALGDPDSVLTEVRADGSWTVKSASYPPDAMTGALSAVSCLSAIACIAVGSYQTHRPRSGVSGDTRLLSERWNGTSWSVLPSRPFLPTDATPAAVSCTSASACTATVGGRAWRWDGTTWAVQPAARGVAGEAEPKGVSCASATACTVVGYDSSGALTERWNGRRWTATPVPSPVGRVLLAVSCTSATACTAAGDSADAASNAELTLVMRWNGSNWSRQPTPNPAVTSGADIELTGVSCTSASACTAVGYNQQPTGTFNTRPLAESWNGRRWTIKPTPQPAYGSLLAVTCLTAADCTAIGDLYHAGPVTKTLAERYS